MSDNFIFGAVHFSGTSSYSINGFSPNCVFWLNFRFTSRLIELLESASGTPCSLIYLMMSDSADFDTNDFRPMSAKRGCFAGCPSISKLSASKLAPKQIWADPVVSQQMQTAIKPHNAANASKLAPISSCQNNWSINSYGTQVFLFVVGIRCTNWHNCFDDAGPPITFRYEGK